MGKKSQARPNGFVLFDVLYEDGMQTSNRKVPAAQLGGFDGDAPARAFVEAQDRDIGAVSGRPRGRIKSISRSRSATNKGAPTEARRAPRNQSFGR